MRKAMMFLLTFLIVAVSLPCLGASAEWAPPTAPASADIYLINDETGTVLFRKNADQKVAPYSITKLTTAILTMQKYKDSLNTVITVQRSDLTPLAGSSSSLMDLKPGQQLTVEQLLDGLLIYSGNDAANVLARAVGGSIQSFVGMMNQEVKKLGCKNTNYINPHGLPDPSQYTTAEDTYKIAKAAMAYSKLAEIVATEKFQFGTLTLPNTNALVRTTSPYYYKYAKGIKTGSGTNFVNCVSYAEKDGTTYYAVVLGGTGNIYGTNTCFSDTLALYKWAFGGFQIMDLVGKGTPQAEVGIDLAWNMTKLQLVSEKQFSALVPSKTDVKTVKVVPNKDVPKSIMAPVKKGQKFGTAAVMLDNQKLGEINLVSNQAVARSKPLYFLYIVGIFFKSIWFKIISALLILLLVFYVVVSFLYNRRKKKRNSGRRRSKYRLPR